MEVMYMNIKDLKKSFENLKQRVLKTEGQKAAAEVGKIISAINEVVAEKNNTDKRKLAFQKIYSAVSKAEEAINDSENLADLQSLISKLNSTKFYDSDDSWNPVYNSYIHDYYISLEELKAASKNMRKAINVFNKIFDMPDVVNSIVNDYNDIIKAINAATKNVQKAENTQNTKYLNAASDILEKANHTYGYDFFGKSYNKLIPTFANRFIKNNNIKSDKALNDLKECQRKLSNMLHRVYMRILH